ncbi:hypothetical protein ILUMI_13034 [Ignelater luminosus]|uniref:Uncharacterized protein n=1 Tax=Ignelater luminosus TaxID=2038154 RepID=A0A8K0CT56_IGNLU|nr:hypothetical protein ILUMI_13034 [Ignelater luminosus]
MNRVVVLLNFYLFCEILTDVTYETFKCTPGVYYEENKCHLCHCNNPSQQLMCEMWWCSDRDDPVYKHCEVGTAWSDGCEKCWCTREVKTICTINCGRIQDLY